MSEASIEVARILITRKMTADGDDIHEVEATTGMALVEALGMIRLAEDTLIQHPPALAGGDDEEDDEGE